MNAVPIPLSFQAEALAQRIARWAYRRCGPGSAAARRAALDYACEMHALGQRLAEAEAAHHPVLTPRQRLRRALRRLEYAMRGWA